ncbi:MFS transporter [Gluconobacter sp. NFX36]|uniref:MFS transporter n=1 Tax=Gluconobacter sp. NFX36 TaxID=2819535 RepID=UPI003CF21999
MASPSQTAALPAQPSYMPPFGIRTLIGCLGMLLAVHVAGFNEHITEIGLSDIRGAMHIGRDEGTWFISTYEAFNIAAMAFTPWFYMTFSIYRFSIFMTAVLALLSIPLPFMPDMVSLCFLRAAQGLSAGCLPPVLMTVMLKYLPPPIKVFGVGGYAMSATFGPNLGGPLEALWFEHFGWHWLYWEVIPLSAIAIAMMAYGLPRDPVHLERFMKFNWRGFFIGVPSILCVVTVLYQGDRLDWFRSPIISHLTFWGGALFVGFLFHEWHHHSPFFRLQYWKNRNIAMAMLTLVGVLVICSLMIQIPSTYLAEVRGYRPSQTAPIALMVALPQLIMLPLTAALCNMRSVDCRYLLGIGMSCLGLAAFLGTWLTPDWVRDNFYLLQGLQVVGQPMVVIPVLVLATMSLGPADGPFISGMVNMLKGMASAVGAALFEILLRRREQYHSNMLLDRSGNNATSLSSMGNPIESAIQNTSPDTAHVSHNALEIFHDYLHEQSVVLALADIYLVVAVLCAGYVVLNFILPKRVYPPGKGPAPKPAPAPVSTPVPAAPLSAPAH